MVNQSRHDALAAQRHLTGSSGIVAGKREVDLYVRTYDTLLQSSGAISVSSFEPAHLTAAPSLHSGATEEAPDMGALAYSIQRLPQCIIDVQEILLGQSADAFRKAGFTTLESWDLQSAPGRRRKWLYDRAGLLAAYIASTSDLDDLVPTIVAYQIECNKLHRLIEAAPEAQRTIERGAAGEAITAGEVAETGVRLKFESPADWQRLQALWGPRFWSNLATLAADRKRLKMRMLGGSYVGYQRTTHSWWYPIAALLREQGLENRPLYLVSSNTHSLVNVLGGTAGRRQDELAGWIRKTQHPELLAALEELESGQSRSSWQNLLYFAARPFFADPANRLSRTRRDQEETERGIHHISTDGALDVEAQVIDLSQLDIGSLDPRLHDESTRIDPTATDAVILNINYPLGFAAYHIFNQIATETDQLKGVYILGKAATLNGRIGDVMISNVVYDEHSGNSYWLDNCFTYADLAPFVVYGAVLDNQKAVTVKGTFLQNQGYLDFYYRENFTVVEMEAGPYLNAIFEDLSLVRYPDDEAINLAQHSPDRFDLGVIHYASDTPYTRAQTLGARGLSYYGMDSTYAATLAILRRTFANAGMIVPAGEPR